MKILNLVFFAIYATEMLIKILGLGLKPYFTDKYNVFDCFLVVTSCIDIGITYSDLIYRTTAIQALRGFRLFRMFRLARGWTHLQNLLLIMKESLVDLWGLALFFLIFLFTYTVLGKEWFAYKLKFDSDWNVDLANGSYIDQNYNTFIEGFTTTFVVITGDNWDDIFYKHVRAVSGAKAAIFFWTLKIIGQYIILMLLLAILIDHFDEDSMNREIKKEE